VSGPHSSTCRASAMPVPSRILMRWPWWSSIICCVGEVWLNRKQRLVAPAMAHAAPRVYAVPYEIVASKLTADGAHDG